MQISHTILGHCSCNEADFSLGNMKTDLQLKISKKKFSIIIQMLGIDYISQQNIKWGK